MKRTLNKKLLVLSTYPIESPRSGGEKRVRALVDYYGGLFKSVKFVGVFANDQNTIFNKENDIILADQDILKRLTYQPYAGDIISGEAIYDNIYVRDTLAKVILDYEPDVIELEHPYPYIGLEPLLKRIERRPKIIYSSHNIEYSMKREIYKTLDVDPLEAKKMVKKIKNLEERLIKRADLVVTVSEDDAKIQRAIGAKNIVVAQNGISASTPTPKSIKHWQKYKKEHGIKKLAVFIASGHPPNWQGFTEMIGSDTNFLPSGHKIALVGGVADYFANSIPQKNSQFWKGIELIGRLDDSLLAGLIAESDLILLPITQGGGSNLKTAEAILSGKPIMATSYAFRSFEDYMNLSTLELADSKEEFKEGIRATLAAKHGKKYKKAEQKRSQQVQWKYVLASIGEVLPKAVRLTPFDYYDKTFGRLKRRILRGR